MLLNLSGVQNFNTNFIPFPLPPSHHATHFSYPPLSLSLTLPLPVFVSVSRFVFLRWAKIYGGAKVKIAKRFQQKPKIQNKKQKKGDDTKRQAGQDEEEERGEAAQEDEQEENAATPLRVNFSCDCDCACICICERLYLLSIRYR